MKVKTAIIFAIVVVFAGIVGLSVADPWGGDETKGVLDEHTTASDFEGADVDLTNMTVSGSGDDAVATVRPENTARESDTMGFNSQNGRTGEYGVLLDAQSSFDGFILEHVDPGTSGTEIHVVNDNTGEVVGSASVYGSRTATETLVRAEIQDGETYRVVMVNDNSFTVESDATDSSYSTSDFYADTGYFDGSSASDLYVWQKITSIDGGGGSAEYQATHSGEGVTGGQVTISDVSNGDGEITWEVNDGSGWSTVGTETVTSAGTYQTDFGSTSGTDYRVTVASSRNDDSTTEWDVAVESETLLIDDHAPIISNLSPEDNTTASDSSETVSFDVEDPEFATRDDEEVTVSIINEGSVIHTETVTQNTTVEYEWSDFDIGDNDWYVVAEDNFSATTQTDTYTLQTPNELRIYNESNPDTLVDSSIDVQVTFFGDDGGVYNRTATDGTVDLDGLPAGERFVVDVDPASDYHQRTVIIESIFTQQNVYVLPTSATSVETRFALDDPTGQFDSETTLFIEKPINRNGSISYETVHADQFGSEGVQATLEEGVRYHLRIESQTGVSQDIGPYRASETETVNVRPGSPTIGLEDYEGGWAAGANIIEPSEGDYKIEYAYDDPEMNTSSLEVTVYEQNNESNQLGATRTHSDLGSVSGTFNLTENQTDTVWVVEFDVSRGGQQFTTTESVSVRESLTGALSDFWRFAIGVSILFVSAGVFSYLNAGVGGVVVAIEGGVLWYTGWLTGATTAAGIAMALFIAIIMHIYRSSGP